MTPFNGAVERSENRTKARRSDASPRLPVCKADFSACCSFTATLKGDAEQRA
jgi:hypothetical protein